MNIENLTNGNIFDKIKYFRLRKRTRHLAIMLTDIKGYTVRTAMSSREQLDKLLDLHEILIKPEFKKFGGRVVKTIGDAFMVVFDNPTDAVLCGVAIQRKLGKYNEEAKQGEELEVKVAVNVGEVTLKKGDVFGEAVNITSRVESLTEANEIYITNPVYLTMNKGEVPVIEVGKASLKGIEKKMRIYKVDLGNDKLKAPPLKKSLKEKERFLVKKKILLRKTKNFLDNLDAKKYFNKKNLVFVGVALSVFLVGVFIFGGKNDDQPSQTEEKKSGSFLSALFFGGGLELSGVLKLKGENWNDVEVSILSEEKEVVEKEKTNKKGEFVIKNLKEGKEYFISISEKVEISRDEYKSRKEEYRKKHEKTLGDKWEDKFRDAYSRKGDEYYIKYEVAEKVVLTENKEIVIDAR